MTSCFRLSRLAMSCSSQVARLFPLLEEAPHQALHYFQSQWPPSRSLAPEEINVVIRKNKNKSRN